MMGVIYSSWSCTLITCSPFVLGCPLISIHNSEDRPWSFDEASCVKKFALAFFARGIYWKSIFRYFYIFLPLPHDLFLLGQLHIRLPLKSASYSALLFVTGNCNLTAYFRISPSGDMRTKPSPPTFLVADPSVWTVHVVFWGTFSS